jgi:hypothetical protein
MTEQYFKEQAIRAERLARAILDERASEALMGLARDSWQEAGSLAGNPVTYGSTQAAATFVGDNGYLTRESFWGVSDETIL